MPKEQRGHGAPRQRPVSCRFCRSRKLRCSRDAPCSNCVSRNLRCELEFSSYVSPGLNGSSESELVERICRLEELVESQKSQLNGSVEQHAESSVTHTPWPHQSALSPPIENLEKDFAWLESIYCSQRQSENMSPNNVVFRISSLQYILEAPSRIALNSTSFESTRCIWLPQYTEAKILLQKFIEDIDHTHHVVHTPSLPSILDKVYSCMNKQGHLQPGEMILLLNIFASSTHSWEKRDCERGLFTSFQEAKRQWPLWIKAAEDILDIAQRTTRISVEGIQGIILSSFVWGNFEGFSRRFRGLYNTAIFLARELGLHYIDHPSSTGIKSTIDAEIGRRVWYYIAASDWTLGGRFNGLVPGIYQCHLRQMAVRKPLNINDVDLIDGICPIEQPPSQPTEMSYSLLRIRLAEIARNIVDRTPLIIAHAGIPSHHVVMDVDTEMQILLNDIPPFFSMSAADITTTYQLDPDRAAKIFYQGDMFHALFYAQRCKLHFPYFLRGYTDPQFAISREICVKSARLIVQTEIRLQSSENFTSRRYKMIAFLLGIFLATSVLLMDLCHNKSSPQQNTQPREIADALRILEEARHESDTAAKFLDSLMQVLRKHKITPPKVVQQQGAIGSDASMAGLSETMVSGATSTQPYGDPAVVPDPMAISNVPGSNEAIYLNTIGDGAANGEDLSSYFNELAQSFEQGIDFDWNDIFSELDSSFM